MQPLSRSAAADWALRAQDDDYEDDEDEDEERDEDGEDEEEEEGDDQEGAWRVNRAPVSAGGLTLYG